MPNIAIRWNAFGFITSFLLALLAVMLLSTESVLSLFVVLGQGHFFLAYLYQWRAGKIGHSYALYYLLALAALFIGLILLPLPELWTFVAAGAIFSVHFAVDELFISGLPITRARVLLCAAFALSYSVLLVRSAYGLELPLIALGILLLGLPVMAQAFKERSISTPETLCLSGIAVLAILWFIPKAISLVAVLGFVILLHYMRWYFYYYFKLRERGDQTKIARYLKDVTYINAVLIAGFCLYSLVPAVSFLGFLFAPTYFYIWTIMHVLSSIRWPDSATMRALFVRHS